jgi:hypothetical protein
MFSWRSVDGHVLKVENCFMFVKHHGCYKTVIPSLDDNYRQMVKQSHENDNMKLVFNGSIIYTMNYYHVQNNKNLILGRILIKLILVIKNNILV